jgi:AcrR family transcriptional regulator
VAAARSLFAEAGYDGASLRAIARRAGVDPALVHHYFASKDALFRAAMPVAVDPRAIKQAARAGGTGTPGERLVAEFVARWDEARGTAGSFATVAQAVAASDATARAFRQFLEERVWTDERSGTGPGDPEWRRSLMATELVGLGFARYVLGVEPLASAPPAEVARRLGPVLDRILGSSEP